jgi:hypothetical protein
MRLKNPGGAGKALETVRKVRDQLAGADDSKDDFLSWCDNWASPQLGNHFPTGARDAAAARAGPNHRPSRPPGGTRENRRIPRL